MKEGIDFGFEFIGFIAFPADKEPDHCNWTSFYTKWG